MIERNPQVLPEFTRLKMSIAKGLFWDESILWITQIYSHLIVIQLPYKCLPFQYYYEYKKWNINCFAGKFLIYIHRISTIIDCNYVHYTRFSLYDINGVEANISIPSHYLQIKHLIKFISYVQSLVIISLNIHNNCIKIEIINNFF